jgi:hypothetical protein
MMLMAGPEAFLQDAGLEDQARELAERLLAHQGLDRAEVTAPTLRLTA